MTAVLLAALIQAVPPTTAAPPIPTTADSVSDAAIAARVEIARTAYGVPHVLAEDLEAMGFGLGYVQSEDYGDRVARELLKSRGEYARYVGHDSIDGDFVGAETYAIAVRSFHRLEEETRDVYRGFAAGVNHYVRLHRDEFPEWMRATFTAYDALSRDVQVWSRTDAARFVQDRGQAPPAGNPDDGSNAWALGPGRSTSGHSILLRNPHLRWSAGYYETHVRVPGVIDFYGDFRIGGAFGIVGGFNRRLGWATTNNYPRYSQVYALDTDPTRDHHYLLDGVSRALEERTVRVPYGTGDGREEWETRTTWWTPAGPVIHRDGDRIYVLKDPRHGEFRRGEQFLKMMRCASLNEWLQVMRMRAHPGSNFTYADADGHYVHLYNARLPLLPHPPTGDTAAVAHTSPEMWNELVPFDDLPLYVDPPGGYVQQANDTPDYTNLNVPMDRDTVPANLPAPRLRLRSQLGLELVGGDERLGLEDVVRRKHSPRMLAAERMVDDLVAAVAATHPRGEAAAALAVLRGWDRTARADSRGGVLFEAWFRNYRQRVDSAAFWREAWTPRRPTQTPLGIGAPGEAVAAFRETAEGLAAFGVPLDVPWGEVHRVRRGVVDEPVSGCAAALGCFRVLSFQDADDGARVAYSGDAWILAVEFGDVPRAYSVLAYGESDRPDSPHYDDQARMFARGKLKTVAFTDEDIRREEIRRYRPGEEVR